MEWYTIANIDSVDTPRLVVYPERIRENIRMALSYVAPDRHRLRPHVKTHKSPQVARMMLDEGITRFKCATIAEAEMLAAAGATDVLLAYQPVGPKAKRFGALLSAFRNTVFSCLLDNRDALPGLSAAGAAAGRSVRILIDLNTGMNRTGIAPGTEALALFLEAARTPGIEAVGLHTYDGHLRDADLAIRKKKCDEAFRPVEALRQEIAKATGSDVEVVAGGSPTFPIHAERQRVACSPGTFVFWDRGYAQLLAEQRFQFAALVVTRIVSMPNSTTLCADLGHKSVAAENPLDQRVHFLNAPDLQVAGQSEEHLVLRAPEHHRYRIGDVLYGVPWHICPTVALYDYAFACRNHQADERWPILARQRQLSI